jgi:hypothetical protein
MTVTVMVMLWCAEAFEIRCVMSAPLNHPFRLIVSYIFGQAIYLIYSQICFCNCINCALLYVVTFRSRGYLWTHLNRFCIYTLLRYMFMNSLCLFNLHILFYLFWLLGKIMYRVLVFTILKGNIYILFYLETINKSSI